MHSEYLPQEDPNHPPEWSHKQIQFLCSERTPQQRSHVMNDDTPSELSVHPNVFYQYAQVANGYTERQVAGDSFESKCPDTSTFSDDAHKLDFPDTLKHLADLYRSGRPETMHPYVLKQDIVVTNDSDHNIQYLDTAATDPLFSDFPDASTSGSTTHDDESSAHGSLDLPPLLFDSGI